MTTYISCSASQQVQWFSTNNQSEEFEMRFWQGIAKTQQENRWLCLISPSQLPNKTLLKAAGINLDRMLIVHANDNKARIQSSLNALNNGKCATVVTWCHNFSVDEQAKLSEACKQGNSHQILVKQAKEQLLKHAA
ncbi:hypothetical protein HR060_04595 [Catenovulum sp. SM1970]|uniref:SulA-like leucine-rich domain-containing protein n=1 Tax=Marinifaba aquimaris TaxID=2741323 RepID=UPI001574C48D|nr:SulA-like leucine-rich domain-containing protein [Marinifaba aquimaris]NTS76140.1 hypothetical protein [Marinifaba aquimaris]